MKEYKFEFPFNALTINLLVFSTICVLGFVVLCIVPRHKPLEREEVRAGIKELASSSERQGIKEVSNSIFPESDEMTERLGSCFLFTREKRKVIQKPYNHRPVQERKFIGRIGDVDGDWILIWKNLETGIMKLEKQ